MSGGRLPTHLWVMAVVRQENAAGRPVMVLRKGERSGGGLLVKINLLNGSFLVLAQQRDLEGRLGWMAALKGECESESQVDDYIDRAVKRDPDLWVVEVEDREAENPFAEGPEALAQTL
ncbi:MAG: DUF1491 family protein [Rhodospirillales bacterium]